MPDWANIFDHATLFFSAADSTLFSAAEEEKGKIRRVRSAVDVKIRLKGSFKFHLPPPRMDHFLPGRNI
jgi:hypothetical protein